METKERVLKKKLNVWHCVFVILMCSLLTAGISCVSSMSRQMDKSATGDNRIDPKPNKGLIINNYKTSAIAENVKRIADILDGFGLKYSIIHYKDFRLDESGSFDFFILSGGGISIETNTALQQEKELARRAPKPIFGICAGFQIIANAYRKVTVKLPEKVRGVKKIKVFNLDKLGIDYSSDELDVYESHGWSIQKPIKGFTILGTSEYGIEIFKHDSKPILATQFHPEVQKDNNGIIILNYFIEKMVLSNIGRR